MAFLSVTYNGRAIKALVERYASLEADVDAALRQGAERGRTKALRYLRSVCPVDTGALLSSLRVRVNVRSDGTVTVVLRFLDYFEYQRGSGVWRKRATAIVRTAVRAEVARVLLRIGS